MSEVITSKIKAFFAFFIPDSDKPADAFVYDEDGNTVGVIVCDKLGGSCESRPVEDAFDNGNQQCEMPPDKEIYAPSTGARIFGAIEDFVDSTVEGVEAFIDSVIEGAIMMVEGENKDAPKPVQPEKPAETKSASKSPDKMVIAAVEVFLPQEPVAEVCVIASAPAVLNPFLAQPAPSVGQAVSELGLSIYADSGVEKTKAQNKTSDAETSGQALPGFGGVTKNIKETGAQAGVNGVNNAASLERSLKTVRLGPEWFSGVFGCESGPVYDEVALKAILDKDGSKAPSLNTVGAFAPFASEAKASPFKPDSWQRIKRYKMPDKMHAEGAAGSGIVSFLVNLAKAEKKRSDPAESFDQQTAIAAMIAQFAAIRSIDLAQFQRPNWFNMAKDGGGRHEKVEYVTLKPDSSDKGDSDDHGGRQQGQPEDEEEHDQQTA